MATCETCGGSGDTENANGCTVPCRTCRGTGQQPEAPAPAAPAELAAVLYTLQTELMHMHGCDDGRPPNTDRGLSDALQAGIALLTRQSEQIAQLEQGKLTAVAEVLTLTGQVDAQAEQLQRQAAVVEAARRYKTAVDTWLDTTAHEREQQDAGWALEAALAAPEATDAR